MEKEYKSEFKNMQIAFEALSEKDAIIYCKKINMPYEDYHEDRLQTVVVKEVFGKKFNKAIVTVTQDI